MDSVDGVDVIDSVYGVDGEDSLVSVDNVDRYTCRRVCVPASRDLLFRDENLFLSLRAPPTECRTNPCGAGSWPWLDQEDGYYRWGKTLMLCYVMLYHTAFFIG